VKEPLSEFDSIGRFVNLVNSPSKSTLTSPVSPFLFLATSIMASLLSSDSGSLAVR
jgi:hypothetical protein